MDQIHQQLVESIKTQLSNGRNEVDIKRDIVSQGWSSKEADEVLRIANNLIPPKAVPDLPPSPSLIRAKIMSQEPQPASRSIRPGSIANIFYSIGSIVILGGIAYAVYYYLTVIKV